MDVRVIPDWLVNAVWFVSSIFATGAFWYFLGQKSHVAALWSGFGAVSFAALAVVMGIHNGLARAPRPTETAAATVRSLDLDDAAPGKMDATPGAQARPDSDEPRPLPAAHESPHVGPRPGTAGSLPGSPQVAPLVAVSDSPGSNVFVAQGDMTFLTAPPTPTPPSPEVTVRVESQPAESSFQTYVRMVTDVAIIDAAFQLTFDGPIQLLGVGSAVIAPMSIGHRLLDEHTLWFTMAAPQIWLPGKEIQVTVVGPLPVRVTEILGVGSESFKLEQPPAAHVSPTAERPLAGPPSAE